MAVTVPRDHHWTRWFDPLPRVLTENTSGDLGALQDRAEAVGLGRDLHPFPEVRAKLARVEAWGRLLWDGQGRATRALEETKQRALAADPPDLAAIDAYIAALEEYRRWMHAEPSNVELRQVGSLSLAELAVKSDVYGLVTDELGAAKQLLTNNAGGLYSRFAQVARKAVEQVTTCLPKVPDDAWGAQESWVLLPADTLATLQDAEKNFRIAHHAGAYLRGLGLQGLDTITSDAPPMALTFLAHAEPHGGALPELQRIKAPLQLAYAVRRGWRPGMWTGAEVDAVAAEEQPPDRRRFLSFLVR